MFSIPNKVNHNGAIFQGTNNNNPENIKKQAESPLHQEIPPANVLGQVNKIITIDIITLAQLDEKEKTKTLDLPLNDEQDDSIIYPPLEEKDINPVILQEAKELAEISDVKLFNNKVNKFLKPPEHLRGFDYSIEHNSALYRAFENKKDEISKKRCVKYSTIINNDYIKKYKPKTNKQITLNTVSLINPIPKKHNKKFICSANLQHEQVKALGQHKIVKENLVWANENKIEYIKIKETKNIIKENLLIQIEKITTKTELLSKISIKELQIQTMLNDFELLMENIKKLPDDDNSENLQTAIDELCNLMDIHIRKGKLFEKDSKYLDIYLECAQGMIYQNSSHYKIKKPCIKPLNKELKKTLENYTSKVIIFVKNQLKNEQKRVKKETETVSFIINNDSSDRIYNHLKTQISVHKKLSYNRFINLLEIHSRFVNRLHQAVSLIQNDQERIEVENILREVLSLNNILQETALHRNCQGRHGDDKERKHKELKDINPLIKLMTLDSTENFVSFECAHIVPSPGLFYRRDDVKSSISKHHVSLSYFELTEGEKDKKVSEDIVSIHNRYKGNISDYTNHILDLVLRLASEESASTIHLPSFFNQEIDGASEKYIELNGVDLNTQKIFLTFKENNFKYEKENKTIIYTNKIYKYLQATAITSMISDLKKLDYKDIFEIEKNYFIATKHAIANKIDQLVQKDLSVANIISAYALINVFKAIKNAEAKAEQNITENDDRVMQAIEKLTDKWQLKRITKLNDNRCTEII